MYSTMFNIRKILMFLSVIQFKKELPNHKMYMVEKRRWNPFNPLTYVCLILLFIVGFVLYGVKGVFEETEIKDAFKWR